MMRRTTSAIALAITCLAAISPSAHAQSALEIQTMLVGKRVSFSCLDGTTGSVRFMGSKDVGEIAGTYKRPGGAVTEIAAQVRPQGGNMCFKSQKAKSDGESCFGVVSRGPGRFQFTAIGGLVGACDVQVL